MKYVFQLCRILAFCFAGELLHRVLPLPIPASIYGLVLLFLALRLGVVKLGQVRETGRFLTGLLPLLFIPPAVGVMALWPEMKAMWLPVLVAIVPVTVLVMAVAGRVTQRLSRKEDKRDG